MNDRPGYWLRRLAGEGCAEHLLSLCLDLPGAALEIKEVRKTVLIDRADVTLENVILQGRLRSSFDFVAATAGAVGWGPVLSLTAEAGFAVRVGIPGAKPAMEARVTDAFVSDSHTRPARVDQAGRILALRDQSIIRLAVQLLCAAEEVSPAAMPALLSPPPAVVVTRFSSRPRGSL